MDLLLKSIKSHWLAILVAALVLLITTVPYIYGFINTPLGKHFTGAVTISYYDTYTYLAWIEQARQGNILFTSLYSTETAVRSLFHPLFLVMGFFGYITHLPNIWIYHIARLLLGAGFLFVVYKFIQRFIEDKSTVDIVFIVLMISSGFGYLLSGISADRWMTEYITFLNLYQSPLNLLSMILILLIFMGIMDLQKQGLKKLFIVAISLNLLVLVHSYDYIFVMPIIGLYSIYQWKNTSNSEVFRKVVWLGILSAPALLWQQYTLIQNTTLGVWANFQTNVPSPHFIHYLTGYGLLLIFVVIALTLIYRKKISDKYALIIIWLIVVPVLLYIPFLSRFQRKFSEGYHIPIVILAGVGIKWWYVNLPRTIGSFKPVLLGVMFLTLSFTNIKVISDDIFLFSKGEAPFYINQTEVDAIKWIRENTNSNSKIVSGYNLGILIPGISGRQVFLGNADQTVNFNQKYELLSQATASSVINKDVLKGMLLAYHLNFFVVDEEVRSWGGLDTTNRPYLKLVYDNKDVQIYQIQKDLLN